MCYNITFLNASIEIGDASGDLKWGEKLEAHLRQLTVSIAYDIGDEQPTRVCSKEPKSEILAGLLWQLNI